MLKNKKLVTYAIYSGATLILMMSLFFLMVKYFKTVPMI